MARTNSRFTEVLMVLVGVVLAACLLVMGVAVKSAVATVLPSSFEDQKVTSLPDPIDLTFTPDGRMLVASQVGKLHVYKNGQLLQTPALDLISNNNTCNANDHGLMGVTVDPSFSTNHYVYLFYTFNKSGGICPTGDQWDPTNTNQPVNRVSRFVMSGDTIDPASEKVLIDNIPTGQHHSGSDLGFGKDGYLYVSVGDGYCDYAGDSGCAGQNDASRDTNVLVGKVLRITRDGDIPLDNPYQGTNSARCNLSGRTDPGKYCQETFAGGLRNPFRFAMDPDTSGTRLFINDVGGNAWEEVDLGTAGADYGWNLCEGNHDGPSKINPGDCTAAPYTPPIYEYSHTTGCAAATGAAFVPTAASWPASYEDAYLYGDYVCNKIFALKPAAGGGYTTTEFATGMGQGGPVSMDFGPYGSGQALYYTTYANGGELHRIAYTSTANRSPTASVKPTSPNYGSVPLTVDFDGSASQDPDGDTLAYLWDFGDGSPVVETSTPTTSHTYTQIGTYTAILTVRDTSGAISAPDTVKVFPGDDPPQLTIDSPAADKLFKVGEQITLHGSTTDPQDGPLPDSSLNWEVRQWHNGNHYHPFLSDTGNDLSFLAPSPEDLAATGPGNYLEIRFTATDSSGLSTTITQELQPNRVNLSFGSQPSGLSLLINGETFTTPKTLVSWEGYQLNVSAPSPQSLGGISYAFSSWSDGGTQTHNVTTEAQPATYTATYTSQGPQTCTITGTTANDTLTGTSGADVICGGKGNDTIKGLGGNDILKGEAGADKLYGGEGNDSLDGGLSNDYANYSESLAAVTVSLTTNTATGEGSDTLVNIERLVGSPKDDSLSGSETDNTINGGDGADTIEGLGGVDSLTGGKGNDTERGGTGNDSVVGSGGADSLFGDDGDDTVNSKDNVNGNDSLDGGPHVNGDTKITDTTEKSIVGFP